MATVVTHEHEPQVVRVINRHAHQSPAQRHVGSIAVKGTAAAGKSGDGAIGVILRIRVLPLSQT